jgi:hypothetical protein
VPGILDQATEEAIRVLQQVGRRIEFYFLAGVQDEDSVVLYDRVLQFAKAVSNLVLEKGS